jgi:hypothetical protein
LIESILANLIQNPNSKKKKEMKTDATPSGSGLVALDGMDKLASCRSDFATGTGLVSG